jgi:hypothetical protein
MTFDEWINNPAGGKSAVMTNRQMYRDLYTAKFNKLMLREGNNFTYTCYKNKDGSLFVIHLKVPSEVVPKFYYDVVVEFTTKNPAYIPAMDLKKYDVRFYSNSPDFVYTHCHAYVTSGLFFADLKKRMNKLSLTKKAVERNPNDEVGYVKSIFFAYLIITSRKLFDKSRYTVPYSEKSLEANVRYADDVVAERQEQGAKITAESKRAKSVDDSKQAEQRASHPKMFSGLSKGVNATPTSKRVGSSKFTKFTKTAKKV